MLNIHNNSGQNVQLPIIVTVFALESSKEVESSYHGQRIIVAITVVWSYPLTLTELPTNYIRVPVGDQFPTVYQPERLGKGREGQGGQSDRCNRQDADCQQRQEPSGCLGKHQVLPGVRQ